MTLDPRTEEIEERWTQDALVDAISDAFLAHPMLRGYKESDRLLIAGALAVRAVREALPLDDLAYLLGRIEALEDVADKGRAVALDMNLSGITSESDDRLEALLDAVESLGGSEGE